jgi:intracellular septation protein A
MTKRKIIFLHILLFLVLTAVLFFYSERLLNIFASGYHDVFMWLNLIIYGTIGIFIITIISCIVFIKRRKINK